MGRVYANPGPTLPGGADPGWTEGALRVGGNIKTPIESPRRPAGVSAGRPGCARSAAMVIRRSPDWCATAASRTRA